MLPAGWPGEILDFIQGFAVMANEQNRRKKKKITAGPSGVLTDETRRGGWNGWSLRGHGSGEAGEEEGGRRRPEGGGGWI